MDLLRVVYWMAHWICQKIRAIKDSNEDQTVDYIPLGETRAAQERELNDKIAFFDDGKQVFCFLLNFAPRDSVGRVGRDRHKGFRYGIRGQRQRSLPPGGGSVSTRGRHARAPWS
jgi:hypothetical protein